MRISELDPDTCRDGEAAMVRQFGAAVTRRRASHVHREPAHLDDRRVYYSFRGGVRMGSYVVGMHLCSEKCQCLV